MDPIELITTVNSFYDQAFNRLLIVTFGLIAFIGVIIPIAVGWLQIKTLKAEKSSLLNELRNEINEEREKIEKMIQDRVETQIAIVRSEYESKFEKTTEQIKESSASALARTHHLQGQDSLVEGNEDHGVDDLCHAATLYFAGKEEDNARRCINLICSQCLPKIDRKTFKEFKVQESCDALLKSIKKNNQNSRYKDDIDLLERQVSLASTRESIATAGA